MPVPEIIQTFIQRNHVLSLATVHNQQLHCASCFYVIAPYPNSLIILTSSKTQHGKIMTLNPTIAGTISGQPKNYQEIEGIQFSAQISNKTGAPDEKTLKQHYCKTFSLAKLIPSEVWLLTFTSIKHTCNRQLFAKKTEWYASNHLNSSESTQ